MYKQHQKGFMIVLIRRQIVDVNETTISDFCNAYNVLLPDDQKISLYWKKGDLKTGICDVYISGESVPFFRVVALSNPRYRLKGMAFDRELSLVVFDEYKVSGKEKYLEEEYGKFQELYATLCRFGIQNEDGSNRPPRVLFLGNNYSLTDPYMANLKVPVSKIKPGEVITGDTWAFEDILISNQLREMLLRQNPLLSIGDDAYTRYALDGVSVSDQRIVIIENQPNGYQLKFVFYIENRYLGIYWGEGTYRYWISVIDNYQPSKRRDVACFDFESLIDGTYLTSNSDTARFLVLKNAFRWRDVSYKSIYEGYLFEQIYELI